MKTKVENENQANYESFNSWYECLCDYEIEKQFQRAYANNKFKEFQVELKGKFYCLVKTENSIYEYEVIEDVKIGHERKDVAFTVTTRKQGFSVGKITGICSGSQDYQWTLQRICCRSYKGAATYFSGF